MADRKKNKKKKFKNKETLIEQERIYRGDDKRGPLALILMGVLFAGLVATLAACKPQTTSQKIENAAEDAGHEIKQGAERAKENVEDATKR